MWFRCGEAKRNRGGRVADRSESSVAGRAEAPSPVAPAILLGTQGRSLQSGDVDKGGRMAFQEGGGRFGGGGGFGGRPREMHKAVCAECQKECEVPFKPSGDRPVYCKECFSKRKDSGR